MTTVNTEATKPPKVFISYAWSTPDHQAWVLQLAERLQADGVHVVLDRWDLKPGQDQYHFMEQMVQDPEISKVLVICDKTYENKANERKGGVGTESQIISKEVYTAVSQEKFLPLIKEWHENRQPCLPVFMKSRLYIDLSSQETFEENYEQLLRNIFGRPRYSRPPLGTPPAYIINDDLPPRRTTYKLQAFKDALTNSKATATGLAEDYLVALEEALEEFKLLNVSRDITCQDYKPLVLDNIEKFLPFRDEFIEFVSLICRYGSDPRLFDILFHFFESSLKYIHTADDEGATFESYRFLIPEMFLYLLAILIRHDHFDKLEIFLGQQYFRSDYDNHSSKPIRYNYTIFRPILPILEERCKQSNFFIDVSLSARLLRQRVIPRVAQFMDLMSIDYALFIRKELSNEGGFPREWFPTTLSLSEDVEALPLFEKGTSKIYFHKLKQLLGVIDKRDLVQKFAQACESNTLPKFESIWGGHYERYKQLLNIERLDTI